MFRYPQKFCDLIAYGEHTVGRIPDSQLIALALGGDYAWLHSRATDARRRQMDLRNNGVRADGISNRLRPRGVRPLGNLVIERLMDRLALKLGIDPAELRLRNMIRPEEMPYDTRFPKGTSTVVYDRGDYPHLLNEALREIDYDSVRRAQTEANGRLLGVGVACRVESSGFGSDEPARIRLESDGTARLFLGTTPQGQGHRAFAAQVLADRLGWPMDRIEVTAGDTDGTPWALFTAGSRSAMHVSNATRRAAESVRRILLERAAQTIEANPADLVLKDGIITVAGSPTMSWPAAELIPSEGLEVTETWVTTTGTAYSGSCDAAVVEVDPDSGEVFVKRYVIVCGTGRVINPLTTLGQMHGGFVHGLGYALFEEAIYQPEGGFVSASFLDYAIPSLGESPADLRIIEVDSPTDANPEGVHLGSERWRNQACALDFIFDSTDTSNRPQPTKGYADRGHRWQQSLSRQASEAGEASSHVGLLRGCSGTCTTARSRWKLLPDYQFLWSRLSPTMRRPHPAWDDCW
jgi:CO/xanthine dehydrogenase Mo-binding subunit